jgi:hypothetical protein
MSEQFYVLAAKDATLNVAVKAGSWAEAKQRAEDRLRMYLACARDAADDEAGYSLTLGYAEFGPEESPSDGAYSVMVSIPASIRCYQTAKTEKQAGQRVVTALDFSLGCAVELARREKLTLHIEDETIAIVSRESPTGNSIVQTPRPIFRKKIDEAE